MLLHYFNQGGPLMWPLLACSVALLAALAERTWAHATSRRDASPRGGAAAAPTRGEHRPGIHPFFWEIPPQIGLLGTVIGLVQIFRGGLGPEAFGRGVGVACITTVVGLGIALVARSADHLLVAWAAAPSKSATGFNPVPAPTETQAPAAAQPPSPDLSGTCPGVRAAPSTSNPQKRRPRPERRGTPQGVTR